MLPSDIRVYGPDTLAKTDQLKRTVAGMFEAAMQAGLIPQDRHELPADANVVWTMDESSGAVVGAAVFYGIGNGRLWLDFIHVETEMRRRGHARALLARVREIAQKEGFRRVMLGTSIGNTAMQRLAKPLGFVDDHLIMALRLP